MKHFYLFVVSILIGIAGFSQTAVNFTCNDCSGVSHDLYTELDAGKVIVICWVMPCATCIPNAKTSYNVVSSYQTTYPNRVYFYMVDDYANTVCSSVNSWANTNAMPLSAYSLRFSDASIKMTDYGATGMPKIVVLGGANHDVFFNSTVNTFNSTNLQNAINSALAATAIEDMNSAFSNISLFPSPSKNQATLSVTLTSRNDVKVELYNMVGKKVSDVFNNVLFTGNNQIQINTSDLANGIYFVKVSVADRNKILKMVVSD
jgi:hypothetical protein